MAQQVMLSVRGEARRTIAPDFVTLHCGLGATAGSKADALAQVRAGQQRMIGSLTDLGGVVLTVEAQRSALTWSVGSVGTHDEHDFDEMTGRHGPTGRVRADATVVITARDFSLLAILAEALASVEQLHVGDVSWQVDSDNPAWREVRADAIAAAVVKGRDYATALGGTVTSVEHVADAGLLASGELGFAGRTMSLGHVSTESAATSLGPTDTPSLDPVPQEIHAVVEARLAAQAAPLA